MNFASMLLHSYLPSSRISLILDANGDDKLGYQEYIQPTLGTKWETFATAEAPLFDLNNDGFLSWTEFKITPRAGPTVEQRFEGLDADGDRRLSESEYLHIVPGEERT